MTQKSIHPRVSVYFITYNQEAFVKTSLQSILQQTYTPLEIIISDDASTDQTFPIIQQVVADYQGPHTLVVTQNACNLGIAENINKVWRMAQGELVVNATGSDISMPERVAELVRVWQADPAVYAVCSAVTQIDEHGRVIKNKSIRKWHKTEHAAIMSDQFYWIGSSAAYSRALYLRFGDMHGVEDLVYYRRALLLGKIAYVDHPLVHWRMRGVSNPEAETWYIEARRLNEWRLACAYQARSDLERVADCLKHKRLYRACARLIQQYALFKEIIDAPDRMRRFLAWCRLICVNPGFARKKMKWLWKPIPISGNQEFYNRW